MTSFSLRKLVSTPLPLPRHRIKRIVVRGPNWLGDAVMCTPALLALRYLFPQAHITLWVRPAIADLLQGLPGIDEMLIYDGRRRHAGVQGKLAMIRTLRAGNFELAILFQNAFEGALLAALAGIPYRYGYATDGRRGLLSHPVPVPAPTIPHRHHVYYYQQMLQGFGEEVPQYAPTLVLTEEEETRLSKRLVAFGIDPDDFLIGLNPGSVYGSAKRWPSDRFAETADRLVDAFTMQVGTIRSVKCAIVGGPGEESLGHAIAAHMRSTPLILSGKTSIRELMAVIKRCVVLITNDTGPMHIANALGIPVVAVFGPTDPATTAPFKRGFEIVRSPVRCAPCLLRHCPIDHRCMTHISVDDIYQAARSLLLPSFSPRSSATLKLSG
ncbi:MAG: lipopolysaccharide heptosyltransferase II [Nitrospirae bacterium]|nr:MAG: lipopolysaccharide heptosyltransferase II [Nitrospirota bacterium]